MTTAATGDGPGLVPDCGSCFGLCCVALPFARSVDFPTDKAAGDPCRNLLADSRCSIHDRLRGSGYRGCTVFECFGAGQQVSRVTFGGRDWRDHPDSAGQMYAVFPVMRQLHEMLVHLAEAGALTAVTDAALTDSALTDGAPTHRATFGSLGVEVASLAAEVTGLVEAEADRLEQLDVVGLRARVGALLDRASRLVRSGAELGSDLGRRRIGRGADLVGADLRGLDLRGADLRGACLIAADLRSADLRRVDLLGADLRDADLRGTSLSRALFVTQPQLNAARGDARTSIAGSLSRPRWWPRTSDGPLLTMDRD